MAYVTTKLVKGKAGKDRKVYLAKWQENGKTREKSFSMKRQATSYAHEMAQRYEAKQERTSDEEIQFTRKPFEEVAIDYLKELAEGYDGGDPLEPHTHRTYDAYLVKHVYPYFALVGGTIATVRREDIEELRDRALASGLAPRSVREVLRLTKAVLKYAVARGYIAAVPGAEVVLRVTRSEKNQNKANRDDGVFDPHQIKTLLAAADSLANDQHKGRRLAWRTYRGAIYVLTMTGVRISELRGFNRRAYDPAKRTIHITQRADEDGNIGITKSADGRRRIPVPPELVEPLETAISVHGRPLVFSTENGNPYDVRNLRTRMLDVLIERANKMANEDPSQFVAVPSLGFHAFRHAYASKLIATGFTLKHIQVWMGHHSPAFTLQRYGHLFEDDVNAAALLGGMKFG